MTLFSGGREIIDGSAESPAVVDPEVDAEIMAGGTETEHASDQPSWPKRLLGAYVETVRQSSAYADQVGKLALSGDIGGAIRAAIGIR